MNLGIDLGTSNTVAAAISRDGSPALIPDAYNKQQVSTPSVALIEGRKAFAGAFAENLFETLPDRQLISFFKRSFGTQTPVYFDDSNNAWFSESVAALVLKKIKYDAELYLPDGLKQCVITVPAHYNDIQRKSVIDSAKLAGLELSAIMEEPVAAALSYSNLGTKIDEEIILIYDFGGGTFDLTLITRNGSRLSVIAKDGVNKLGGKEFDEIVRSTITETYEKTYRRDFPADKLTANRIQKVSEQIKIELNNRQTPGLLRKWIMVNKEIFETCFDYNSYAAKANVLIAKTESAVNRCLRSLGMQLSDVNKFVLIGGTSSSKLVYNFWQNKMQPGQELVYHQPLSSVASGAALYAASLADGGNPTRENHIELRGVSTYNIGLILQPETNKHIDLLIHRNTPLPIVAKKVYRLDSSRSNTTIELCQFWDAADAIHRLGLIKIGGFEASDGMNAEISVENRMNGTIGIKVRNADTGRDLRFEFVRQQSQHTFDFHQQQTLIDNIYLNNYL